jgi:regulator of PEP synthase PpsR (kinase-PPPase family)
MRKVRGVHENSQPTLFVVSDGRGDTCQNVLRAALVQFEHQEFDLILRPNVRTAEQVAKLVEEARYHEAVIFYTLVIHEARVAISRLAEEHLVPIVDVLGPSFSALHDVLKSERTAKPGLYYASDRERFDRQAAIDYTLKHDDGQRPHELHLADVVLVGVSRASKSTTCFYLAFQGIKAANVPLLPGIPVPHQLTRIKPAKVIGLNMNVARLMTVREARTVVLGTDHTQYYVNKREIANEVIHATNLMKAQNWRSIDASYMAIEEIAREVRRVRGL